MRVIAFMELSSILGLFGSRGRQRRIAIAALIAVAIATVVVIFADTRGESSVKTGDFPAFYSLAVITHRGDHSLLYDIKTQTQIQNEFWPDMGGSVLPAAYPPYVAYLIKPLAVLGPVWGKAIWTIICFAVFFISVRILSGIRPTLRGHALELSAGLLLFTPVLMGVIGGQLLAASMLAYVSILKLDQLRTARSELLLGVVIGLWLFKPQYSLIALAIPLVQSRWLVVAGFSLIAAILYCIGVGVMGANWIGDWLSFTHAFAEMNFISNAVQMPNIVGGAIALTQWFDASSGMQSAVRAGALGLCLVLLIYILSISWQQKRIPNSAAGAFFLLGPFLAFATPQSNFYDLGLAVIPLVLLARADRFNFLYLGVPLLCVGCIATVLRPAWLPIFVFIAGALFFVVAKRLRQLAPAL